MNIDWNHVTRYSQIIAIVLFVGVFVLGFFLGKVYEGHAFENAAKAELGQTVAMPEIPEGDATYACDANKSVHATYYKDRVEFTLSDGRKMTLPHAISADGARYANADESFVLWNKGNTLFITEGTDMTYANCVAKPIPE